MPSAHPCRQQHQDKKRASCIFARTGFSCRLPLLPLTAHGRRGATPCCPVRGHGGIPRHGGAPGAGSTGQGCRGHGDGCSGCQREAPSLGKPSPGGGCCPRRGSGTSAARCSQGAHSAPDAFSNLARLARLRQRGRGASVLTLARPGGRPCGGSVGAGPGPGQASPGQPAAPRGQGASGEPQYPPQTKASPAHSRSPCVSPINRGPGRREPSARQCSPNTQKLVPAASSSQVTSAEVTQVK